MADSPSPRIASDARQVAGSVRWRVVFLTEGEAPPSAVVELLAHASMEVEGRELDAFFAELDMGFPIPDLLVGVGGDSLVRALRKHETTACLPLFRWGSTATVPAGWDGSVVRWNEARLSDVALWLERLAPFPHVADADEAERREHLFLRFLATRGSSSLADAKVFGVKAPHAALRRWTERGWCHGTVQHLQATHGLLDVVGRERLKIDEHLAPPGAAPPDVKPQGARVEREGNNEGARRNPSARSDMYERSLSARFAWILIVVLLALVVYLFDKAGGTDWLRGLEGVAEAQDRGQEPVAQGPKVGESLAGQSMAGESTEDAPASLPELFLDGRLIRPVLEVQAALAGEVRWAVASGAVVEEGSTLGFLTQAAGLDQAVRLERLRGDLEDDLAVRQAEAQDVWEQALEAAAAESRRHLAEVQRLERRLPELQANYDHARALAEQGVLSFREIRPEWEAMVAEEEALTEARNRASDADQAWASLKGSGPPDLSAQPSWASQVQTLSVQLEEAQANVVRVPITAPRQGVVQLQALDGTPCLAGTVLAFLTPHDGGHIEAVLATPDWHPRYLEGNARLRRPGRSSWMPTRVLAAVSEPDGLTRLQLRLPVGWLDDALVLADADQHLLELRMTAPAPPVPEQEAQPPAAVPVESEP